MNQNYSRSISVVPATGILINRGTRIAALSLTNSDASAVSIYDGGNVGTRKWSLRTPTAGGSDTISFDDAPLNFKTNVYIEVVTAGTAPILSIATLEPEVS